MPAAARDYGRRLRCARRLLNGTLFASLRSATHSLRTTAHCLATLGHLPRYARLPPRFARQLIASVTAPSGLATLGRSASTLATLGYPLASLRSATCLATLGYPLASLGIIGLARRPRYARPSPRFARYLPRYARHFAQHCRPRLATLGHLLGLASLGACLAFLRSALSASLRSATTPPSKFLARTLACTHEH